MYCIQHGTTVGACSAKAAVQKGMIREVQRNVYGTSGIYGGHPRNVARGSALGSAWQSMNVNDTVRARSEHEREGVVTGVVLEQMRVK